MRLRTTIHTTSSRLSCTQHHTELLPLWYDESKNRVEIQIYFYFLKQSIANRATKLLVFFFFFFFFDHEEETWLQISCVTRPKGYSSLNPLANFVHLFPITPNIHLAYHSNVWKMVNNLWIMAIYVMRKLPLCIALALDFMKNVNVSQECKIPENRWVCRRCCQCSSS